jgi:NADH:ubiquinone oxidoreductase subunit 6 (subunit J)
MPLYNFKLIPYLYDAFKPMLVGHIILFNDSFLYKDMADDYFNINYEYYWLPISKLIQSLMNILILLGVMIMALTSSFGDEKLPSDSELVSTQAISDQIFGPYLLPFWALSFVLLVAVIGAIVLARKD